MSEPTSDVIEITEELEAQAARAKTEARTANREALLSYSTLLLLCLSVDDYFESEIPGCLKRPMRTANAILDYLDGGFLDSLEESYA